MSRPIIEIGQVTYATASNLVTIPVSAFRIRGTVDPAPNADNPALTITGFSQSILLDLDDNGALLAADGLSPYTYTFSADLETSTASTSDTTTYVPAFVDLYISGTAVDGDLISVQYELGLQPLRNKTFGDTFSAWEAVDFLLATFSSTFGFTASRPTADGVTPAILRITSPWGAYYNGLNIGNDGSANGLFILSTTASSTLSASFSGGATVSEFLGGITKYNLSLNAPDYFGFSDDITFNFEVGSTQSGEV